MVDLIDSLSSFYFLSLVETLQQIFKTRFLLITTEKTHGPFSIKDLVVLVRQIKDKPMFGVR